MNSEFSNAISYVAVTLGVLGGLSALYLLIKSGMVRRVRFFNFEIETNPESQKNISAIIDSIKKDSNQDIPFEIAQLAKYYTQILYQTKVSFWFSLVFAVLGFSILIIIIFTNPDIQSNKTIVSFLSTAVIEAVSVLFFTRSNNAQKEMEQFFNKLRKDRQQAEARKMAESIENPLLKDVIKIQLALAYSEINNDTSSINEAIKDTIKTSLGIKTTTDIM